MQTAPTHDLSIADIEAAINYWRLLCPKQRDGASQTQDQTSIATASTPTPTPTSTPTSTPSTIAIDSSHDDGSLSPEVRALAQVYGSMIYQGLLWLEGSAMPLLAYQAWLQWYASTPDTPCIAICSTSQGDAFCKGCGRSADEVKDWVSYSPAQKRRVWFRLQAEGTAWRFTRYLERSQTSE